MVIIIFTIQEWFNNDSDLCTKNLDEFFVRTGWGILVAACKESHLSRSDSPGLVDFAIRLVYRSIVINPANQKGFWG